MANIMQWFVSPFGRKVMNVVAGITSTGCFTAYLLPHSLFLDKTKEFLQMYKGGEPVPLPDDLLNKAKQVLEETTLNKREKNLVSFFMTVGTDVTHAGSTQLKKGAAIGIPLSYKFRSLSDINPQSLQIVQQSELFSWNSKIGQRILTTLLMSNRAQQFSIAREIYYSNTHYVYLNGFIAMSNFIASYLGARYMNTKLNLYARPFAYRLSLYSIIGSMGFIMFLFMKDTMNVYNETQADKLAASLGKNYVLGGLEYYEYLIERNKSIREALGKKGEKLYTAGGNVKEWIRVSRVPLTSRFNYMKECLKNLEEKGSGPGVTSVPSKILETPQSSISNSLHDKDIPLRGL